MIGKHLPSCPYVSSFTSSMGATWCGLPLWARSWCLEAPMALDSGPPGPGPHFLWPVQRHHSCLHPLSCTIHKPCPLDHSQVRTACCSDCYPKKQEPNISAGPEPSLSRLQLISFLLSEQKFSLPAISTSSHYCLNPLQPGLCLCILLKKLFPVAADLIFPDPTASSQSAAPDSGFLSLP